MNESQVKAKVKFRISDLSVAVAQRIFSDLTFKSINGEKYGFGVSQTVCLLEESDGFIYVPRSYAFERLGNFLSLAKINLCFGDNVDFSFNEEAQQKMPDLKARQDILIQEFLSALKRQTTPFQGGIFSAPCGTGKTVILLKIFSILKKTALVLVHKEFLAEQFRERIKYFLGLKDAEIGTVKGSKCCFEGKKIVIAMIQSLLSREYPSEFYEWPGVLAVDECHRISAPLFNQTVDMFPAAVRIGLSATPRRADGLQNIFEIHLGSVLARLQGGTGVVPKIYQVPFDVLIQEHYYKGKEKIFLGRLISYIVNLERRNNWLVKEMVKAIKVGRKIFVMSDRIDHLKTLKEKFDIAMPTATSGLYIGGMKAEERERSAAADAIFGTYAMTKEGLDLPEIDTLYLATPKSDIEQPVGRVLRYSENKKEPVVVDLVDSVPILQDFARKRLKQYKSLGYDVKAIA